MGAAAAEPAPEHRPDDAMSAWSAVGRLLAGPALYGGLGYGLDRWFGTAPALLCVGVVLGFALAIYLTIAVVDAQARAAGPVVARPSTRVRRTAPTARSVRRDPKGTPRGR